MNFRDAAEWEESISFDEGIRRKKNIHVYPKDDIQEHKTDGPGCWCNPVSNNDEPSVIVHNRAKDTPQ